MDSPKDVLSSRQLSVAIVGAAHPNKDGGNRRSEIAFCDPGEALELRPEPKNEHDEHAIAVFSARAFQIGYVSSQRAVFLKALMRAGHEISAVFQDIAPWGAVARIGVDCQPVLPPPGSSIREAPGSEDFYDQDPGFWPDDEPAYD